MHEMSMLRGLMQQIDALARRNGPGRVRVVRLKLGPLAHIEPDHLREHFVEAARGTVAESARLDVAVNPASAPRQTTGSCPRPSRPR